VAFIPELRLNQWKYYPLLYARITSSVSGNSYGPAYVAKQLRSTVR
jgi:hypothetical protein